MNFDETIKNINWVFFDFFETIVHRSKSEQYVVQKWAADLAPKICFALSAEELIKYRNLATKNQYQKNKGLEEITYENILHELYCVAHEYLTGYTFEAFYELSYNIELEAECSVQTINLLTREKIITAREQGKHIGIISDFYFGRKEIEYFLKQLRFETNIFEKIYVSADYGKKKKTGNLYEIVLKDISCVGEECLMVGDNEKADIFRAKEKGFKTFYCPALVSKGEINVNKKLIEISRENKNKLCANYAFGLYYYIEQIYETCIKNGYTSVIFLSREGYVLKKLFEIYQEKCSVKIQTKYLYVSRLATLLPSLYAIEEESFDAILKQYRDMSLRAFLANLQMNEDVIDKIAKELEIDPDDIIFELKNSKQFAALKKNSLFLETYERLRKSAHHNVLGYLDDIVGEGSPLVLIDIGWKGTMQDNIFKIYRGKRNIIGLYYGVFNQTGLECNYNIKKGLVFNKFPVMSRNYWVWEFETHLIEQLLSAPHGSTKGYIYQEDRYIPILEKNEADDRLYEKVVPIQRNILSTFQEINEVYRESASCISSQFKFITQVQLRTELCLSKEMIEFEKIALSENTNNFGWFSNIPQKANKPNRIKKILMDLKHIHNLDKNFSVMKYLNYISIKMNAREKYGWKKCLYRIVYFIERWRVV